MIEAKDRLLIPGLVNAHTHSHANIPRSFGDRWTLELALNANGAIRGQPSVEEKYLAAQLGAAEMIRKGCTACYDLVVRVSAAQRRGAQRARPGVRRCGMRAVVAPLMSTQSFYAAIPGLMEVLPRAHPGGFPEAPRAHGRSAVSRSRARRLHDWPFDRSQVRLAIAPHSPLQVSDEFWIGAHRLAKEFGVGRAHAPRRIQGAGGRRHEALREDADGAHGRSGRARAHFTAAHGTWLDEDDMKRLADAGASVAHNPASNMRYGNGMAAVRRMLDCGLNVGLGTDSRSCSDNLNMFEAMRLASFTSRVQTPDYKRGSMPTRRSPWRPSGSAKVLGFGDDLGRIEAGYKADIVFLDLSNLNYVPLNSAINQVVNAEDATGVDSVMIGGRLVLDRGRLTTIDVDRLVARAEAAMERVWALNGKALELALGWRRRSGRSAWVWRRARITCIATANRPTRWHHCENPKGNVMRVEDAQNIFDLREMAKRRLPKWLFEFVDRGTEEEVALRNNREAFERIKLLPRMLVDVSGRKLDTTVFGKEHKMPIGIAPTGAAGMMWYRGELELARAAKAAGIPFSLATGSITSMEKVAGEVGGTLWMQLYMWADRKLSHQVVRRAAAAGFEALLVTVDGVGRRQPRVQPAQRLLRAVQVQQQEHDRRAHASGLDDQRAGALHRQRRHADSARISPTSCRSKITHGLRRQQGNPQRFAQLGRSQGAARHLAGQAAGEGPAASGRCGEVAGIRRRRHHRVQPRRAQLRRRALAHRSAAGHRQGGGRSHDRSSSTAACAAAATS